MRKRALFLGVLVASLIIFVGHNRTAAASTITVNTFNDVTDADKCTLRAAIMSANADALISACVVGSGDDIIELPAGTYTLALAGTGEDDSYTGDLDIKSNITIKGASGGSTTIDANDIDRIFHIISGNVTLENIEIKNGDIAGNGGAIYNEGTLTLKKVTVSDSNAKKGGGIYNAEGYTLNLVSSIVKGNTATTDNGGGIYNYGILTVNGSVIEGNVSSKGSGGGIYNLEELTLEKGTITGNKAELENGGGIFNSWILKLQQCAIIGNTSGEDGAGIYNGSVGDVTIVNSTIGKNVAKSNGGGIYNMSEAKSVIITNATIVENNAGGYGGGIANDNFTVKIILQNTILANNVLSSKDDVDLIIGKSDCWGEFSSYDPPNIIGDLTEGCSINTGTNQLGKDPKLTPLDSQTNVYSLSSDSPAVDSGACEDVYDTDISEDQLGTKRPAGNGCDIGAVEVVFCGDGVIQKTSFGEECDGSNLDSQTCGGLGYKTGLGSLSCTSACKFDASACVSSLCGDAIADTGEGCDDGNADETDDCLSTCVSATCGDGKIKASVETCDNGASNSDTTADACRTKCIKAYCSDGVQDTGEECDDGNLVTGDGCSDFCVKEASTGTTTTTTTTTTSTTDTTTTNTSDTTGDTTSNAPAAAGGCSLIRQ